MRFALAILALATSCARPGVASGVSGCPAPTNAAPARDSVRGLIDVVGSEPGTWVVITPAGGRPITLDGERPLLLQMQGLEVVVFGTRSSANGLRVQSAIVRATGGSPAVDGILARELGGDFLVTCDGRRLRIGRLPESLRGANGARVWMVGPLEAPTTFGILKL
jgi:hypothetical protein